MSEFEPRADFGAFSGCGRKLRPGALVDYADVLTAPANAELPQVQGLHQLSDVGQARLLPDGGLVVQTVDVVLPLPVQPASWGRAAALHCVSDIYASGARPVAAVGIVEVGSSRRTANRGELKSAYRAAVETLNAEGIAVIGGHSLMGEIDKIGFAITGVPDASAAVRSVANAEVGDRLYVSKPVGLGAIFASISAGQAVPAEHLAGAERWMLESSATISSIASGLGLTCSSDVSGYGLLGTCLQIAAQSQTSIEIDVSRVPVLPGALNGIRAGIVSNLAEAVWLESEDFVATRVGAAEMLMLADPQVSGGLVLAIPPAKVSAFEEECRRRGVFVASFGQVGARGERDVVVS